MQNSFLGKYDLQISRKERSLLYCIIFSLTSFKNSGFSFETGQPRTQDLEHIHCQTCAFFIWKTETFKNAY